MALGDLNRIESGFAEATFDPGMWGRALDVVAHETGSFVLPPLADVPIPNVPATEAVGEALCHYFRDRRHLIETTPRRWTSSAEDSTCRVQRAKQAI
jgi:hypothetical protein